MNTEGLKALERIGKRKYKTTVADIAGFETVVVSVKQDNKQDYNIIEKELRDNENKLAIICDILVDVSKGNYSDLKVAIEEIREVL